MAQKHKATGICKRFNSIKGFGFIACDDGSGDIFVHQTEIYSEGFQSLAEGEKLEFDVVVQYDGSRKAVNVTGPGGDYVKGQETDNTMLSMQEEWIGIVRNALPDSLRIEFFVKNLAEYSYPILHGVYGAFVSTLFYINQNGQCRCRWLDTYWKSPLYENVGSDYIYQTYHGKLDCTIEYFHNIGVDNIRYEPFEKWTYDFDKNIITLRCWDQNHMFGGPKLLIGKLKYGNIGNDFASSANVKQSEYEWHFEARLYSDTDVPKDNVLKWKDED